MIDDDSREKLKKLIEGSMPPIKLSPTDLLEETAKESVRELRSLFVDQAKLLTEKWAALQEYQLLLESDEFASIRDEADKGVYDCALLLAYGVELVQIVTSDLPKK